MKIRIDRDLCEANGRCEMIAPSVFRLEDDDSLSVLVEVPGEDVVGAVRKAVDLCPRRAIFLDEGG